jgi:biopolymer transport protein ExbD
VETWDVFRSDRLELQRSMTTAAVRAAVARGDLRDDDLIRPAGSSAAWGRVSDLPALAEPPVPADEEPTTAPFPTGTLWPGSIGAAAPAPFPREPRDELTPFAFDDDLVDDDEDDREVEAGGSAAAAPRDAELGPLDLDLERDGGGSRVALPVAELRAWVEDEFDPQDEDEEAAEFTLDQGRLERVEELDLAAMVDVAFQMVLFFLVTAATVLYKTLEVPKPNPESPPGAVAQGRSRTLDDLKDDFILVEIDAAGAIKIDREPVAAALGELVERLRSARERTGRKAMLLSAEFATAHRHAVLAYDAANEIGLGIAIARPSGTTR